MNGNLSPGTRIVEAKWAQRFGVAQGTIREAMGHARIQNSLYLYV
jgi:DNA-binding GntR family transcriptional regulator